MRQNVYTLQGVSSKNAKNGSLNIDNNDLETPCKHFHGEKCVCVKAR